jgi:flagellar hook assembly protein FlgD
MPSLSCVWTTRTKYQFRIDGKGARSLESNEVANALDSIKVVPNPYYGYSQYETSQFSNVVKITNLPGKCTVTIYSLDGKFIRQYKRDETYEPYNQISPELEWDLRNSKGIPVASGVYLININAPGMGERTVKWFGIARQFDPSGL